MKEFGKVVTSAVLIVFVKGDEVAHGIVVVLFQETLDMGFYFMHQVVVVG